MTMEALSGTNLDPVSCALDEVVRNAGIDTSKMQKKYLHSFCACHDRLHIHQANNLDINNEPPKRGGVGRHERKEGILL